MRLTVHLTSGAKKSTKDKRTPEGPVKIKQTFTTLSFSDVHPDEVNTILAQIKDDGQTVGKSYLSNERIAGRARGKKKS
jgi:hypothetical protein